MIELNLDRDFKGNKKSFCRYVGEVRKSSEYVDSFQKETGNLEYGKG